MDPTQLKTSYRGKTNSKHKLEFHKKCTILQIALIFSNYIDIEIFLKQRN